MRKPWVSEALSAVTGALLLAHALTQPGAPAAAPPTLGVGAGLLAAALAARLRGARIPWEAALPALAGLAASVAAGSAPVGPAAQATLALAVAVPSIDGGLGLWPRIGAWLLLGASAYASIYASPPGEWALAASALAASALAPGAPGGLAAVAGLSGWGAGAPWSALPLAVAAGVGAWRRSLGPVAVASAAVAYQAGPGYAALLVAAGAALEAARILGPERLAAASLAGAAAAVLGRGGGLEPGVYFAAAFLAVSAIAAAPGYLGRRPGPAAVFLASLALLAVLPVYHPGSAPSGCPEAGLLDYSYNASGLVAVEPGESRLVREALEAAAFDPGDPVEALIAASRAAALVESPGVIANATIVDLRTGENETVSVEGSFLVLPLGRPVTVLYAVEPGGEPVFRAALRLPSVIVPPEAVGGVPLSPVHTLVVFEFESPMILEAAGGYRIEVYRAVLASSIMVGENATRAEETPAGTLWTNAVLGVARGVIVAPGGEAVPVPSPVGEEEARLQERVSRLWTENESLARALSAAALAGPGGGEARVPEALTVEAALEVGGAGAAAYYQSGTYKWRSSPAVALSGVDACIYMVEPGPVELEGARAPYPLVEALAEALDSGALAAGSLAEAWTGSPGEAAGLLWLASQWDVLSRLPAPEPAVEASRHPWAAASMIGLFLLAASGALALLGEARRLAPGAEPELPEH